MRKIYLVLIILYEFSVNLCSLAEITGKKVLFGPVIGRSTTHGYYKDQLSNGYIFGIFADYTFFDNPFLLFEGNFAYAEHSLEKSASSEFSIYRFGAGPVLFIPLHYVQPYLGILANINYFNLKTIAANKNEKTVKPGAAVKSGINIPLLRNFSVNIGIGYSFNELSAKLYQDSTYYAGLTYTLNFFTREKVQSITRQIEIDEYYETGLKYFKQGDGIKAKEYFRNVIEYDNSYKDVEHYVEIIRTSEKNYDKALKYISDDKLFEAIPLLIDTGQYLIKASLRLAEVRKKVADEEKKLESLGIQAYDREDYERCIYYMNKVQLINPENNSVKIYLPRAIRRFNALKKLD